MSASRAGDSGRAARTLFAVGLCLYLALQVGSVAATVGLRSLPAGTTDAYSYISKAEQLRRCLFRACPALADLRAQSVPDLEADFELNTLRVRQHHRVIYQYHPLHSAALAGLHALGVSWEGALDALSIAGAVLIAAGAAYFLYALWGWAAAGLGLALLATAVYPGFHGTHWIVPGNMALGVGLLSWAAVIDRRRWGTMLLPLLVLAMLWLHPVGRIYAVMALILHVLLIARSSRASWPWLGAALLAAAASVGLPAVTDWPALHYQPPAAPEDWSIWQGIADNVAAAWRLTRLWFDSSASLAMPALAIAGLATVPRDRRLAVLGTVGLLAAVMAASLFYAMPTYPAELFHRAVVPFALACAGAAGHAVCGWWRAALVRRGAATGAWFWAYRGLAARATAAALGAVLLVGAVWERAAVGGEALWYKTAFMIGWGRMDLDLSQPGRVLADLSADDGLVYMDELALYFYLSNGGYDFGLSFKPDFNGEAEAMQGRDGLADVRYAVSAFPVQFARIPLRPDWPLEVHFGTGEVPARIVLRVENTGRAASLALRDGHGSDLARIAVPASRTGWIAADLPAGHPGGRLVIVNDSGVYGPWLRGIRLASEDRHDWPWDQGVTLLRPPAPIGDIAMDSDAAWHEFDVELASGALVPPTCVSLGVIEDGGATVVARVDCRRAQNAERPPPD